MNPAMLDLGRRAVKCKGWRWLPGMRTTAGERLCTVFFEGPAATLARYVEEDGAVDSDRDLFTDADIPDLSDPATLGCIEHGLLPDGWYIVPLVRGDPGVVVAWVLYQHDETGPVSAPQPTKAAALISALEAAETTSEASTGAVRLDPPFPGGRIVETGEEPGDGWTRTADEPAPLTTDALSRLRDVQTAARAMLARWDEVLPAINGAEAVAFIHGWRYDGPSMGSPVKALRDALDAAGAAPLSLDPDRGPDAPRPPLTLRGVHVLIDDTLPPGTIRMTRLQYDRLQEVARVEGAGGEGGS